MRNRRGLVDRAMDKAANIGGPAARQGFNRAMSAHPTYKPPKRVKHKPRTQTQKIQAARTFSCSCQERK